MSTVHIQSAISTKPLWPGWCEELSFLGWQGVVECMNMLLFSLLLAAAGKTKSDFNMSCVITDWMSRETD